MKMRISASLILSVVCAVSHAGQRIKDAYKAEFKEGTFSASAKEGFHFNAKAPNAISFETNSMKPTKLEARVIEFKDVPASLQAGRVSLYICDDAVTFCETEIIPVKEGGVIAAAGAKAAKKDASVKTAKPNKHGFIEDDYGAALALAQKENRLLLIDFSARWCPGCIRLESETFGTKEFKALTANFVKLKIDVDRFENNAVSEKFKLQGIPSLIVVNAKQEEISRFYDYQPMPVIQSFFDAVKANSESIADLKTKAATGDPAMSYELGKRLLAADQPAEAVHYLAQVKPVPDEYLKATVDAASKDSNKENFAKALRDAIRSEPESSRSLAWRHQLITITENKATVGQLSREGIALADAWLNDRAKMQAALKTDVVGEFTGYEPLYIGFLRADLFEIPGADTKDITAAWKRAADAGLQLKIPLTKTGLNIRLLAALIKGENFKEADRLTLALMKTNPGNPEVQRRRLKVLTEQKKYEEVVDLGQKVLKNSYGRNEFWVAEAIAKAYVESGRKKEAKSFIDKYLGREEIRWDSMASSRKALEDLKVKVN